MNVIDDEKPKRGEHKPKKHAPNIWWLGLMTLFIITFVAGILLLTFYLTTTDIGGYGVSEIELSATQIVRQNATTFAQATQTAEFYPVTVTPNIPATATEIAQQQIDIAQTQAALETREAQIIITLTAETP